MKDTKEESNKKIEMTSLVSCMNMLLADGFNTQFKAMESGLKSLSTNIVFQPEQVEIINFYRFEGESDPADSSILYAIETSDGEKGTLTDSYGPYADTNVTKFIQKVEEIHKIIHSDKEEKK
jgi:hypothetical protein